MRPCRILDSFQEQLGCGAADLVGRLFDDREGRVDQPGPGGFVETGEGDVIGNRQFAFLKCPKNAGGQQAVAGQDGIGGNL